MFPRLLAAAVVATSLFLSTHSSAQIAHRGLTPEEIEAAIEAGIRGDTQPYRLRERSPERGWAPESAYVTTPHLRVQLAASRAWRERRHRLTPEEIPRGLLAPVALITMPFGYPEPGDLFTHEYVVCEGEGTMEFAAFRKGKDRIPRNSDFRDDVPPELRPMRPLWQTEADLAEMWPSVTQFPHGDDGITVAYPLEFLRSDLKFVLRHRNHDGDCHGIGISAFRIAHIHPEDLATWR